MALASGKKESREVSLGDDFGPATVKINDMTLVIDADGKPTLKTSGDATIITNGNITAYSTDGNVTAYINGTVQLKASAPEQTNGLAAAVTKQACNIGDVLPDGWVVGPVSPDTGFVMSIEPAAGALYGYKTWYQGQARAAELRGQGNANARQPSRNELNALYNNIVKAEHNGNAKFGESVFGPFGEFWSSTTLLFTQGGARIQFFDNGARDWHYKDLATARVRCVRDEPKLSL